MEHRGALRKTKAFDLGLDMRADAEVDEFQNFVAQSYGRSPAEPRPPRLPRGELKEHGKPRSCDADASLSSSAQDRSRPMERSVTHDGPVPRSPNRTKRDEHHERENRSCSLSPRPGPKCPRPVEPPPPESDGAQVARKQYQTRRHLTVPGLPDEVTPTTTATATQYQQNSIQSAASADQLAPPRPPDSRRSSRGDVIVRNFATSSKGIVNMGDSYKSEDSSPSLAPSPMASRRSSAAVATLAASYSPTSTSPLPCTPTKIAHAPIGNASPMRTSKQQSSDSAQSSTKSSNVYVVHVVGERAVGKSSLCRQFVTSEYLGDSDPDLFEDDGGDNNPTRVTVQVDDHLARVLFYEIADEGQDQTSDDVDAYLIVYAIDQQSSFRYAEHLLANKLSKATRRAPVFLVANKGDLVRTQVIGTDEGKLLARRSQSIFAETSAALCHRLDELLVQIVQEANGRHQPHKSREHTSKITKWLGKLGGKLNPKLKKWHSSPKRSLDTEADS